MKKTCFVAMPISVPKSISSEYEDNIAVFKKRSGWTGAGAAAGIALLKVVIVVVGGLVSCSVAPYYQQTAARDLQVTPPTQTQLQSNQPALDANTTRVFPNSRVPIFSSTQDFQVTPDGRLELTVPIQNRSAGVAFGVGSRLAEIFGRSPAVHEFTLYLDYELGPNMPSTIIVMAVPAGATIADVKNPATDRFKVTGMASTRRPGKITTRTIKVEGTDILFDPKFSNIPINTIIITYGLNVGEVSDELMKKNIHPSWIDLLRYPTFAADAEKHIKYNSANAQLTITGMRIEVHGLPPVSEEEKRINVQQADIALRKFMNEIPVNVVYPPDPFRNDTKSPFSKDTLFTNINITFGRDVIAYSTLAAAI